MSTNRYTPGHTSNATDFMSRRSVQSHGAFFMPHLTNGLSVLDCGCGPGSITLGIAELVAPAKVIGVDFGASQIEQACAAARGRGIANVEFRTADCYSLPFANSSFDRVFSHALMEHLFDPLRAIGEMHRVLMLGGVAGLCSPDWGDLSSLLLRRHCLRPSTLIQSCKQKMAGMSSWAESLACSFGRPASPISRCPRVTSAIPLCRLSANTWHYSSSGQVIHCPRRRFAHGAKTSMECLRKLGFPAPRASAPELCG